MRKNTNFRAIHGILGKEYRKPRLPKMPTPRILSNGILIQILKIVLKNDFDFYIISRYIASISFLPQTCGQG